MRPYDIMSLMHYGQDDFKKEGVSGHVIDIKAKGYAEYTKDPKQHHKYKPGNRIGLSQSDAEQFADHYKNHVKGGCAANFLEESKTCRDRKCDSYFDKKGTCKQGGVWKDGFGDCEKYFAKHPTTCSGYWAGQYCCKCGGGLQLQKWVKPSITYTSKWQSLKQPPCNDSPTFKDAGFGDTCAAWAGFECKAYPPSLSEKGAADLKKNCPKACKACKILKVKPGICDDKGCGCGKPAPSGCDNKCGSTATRDCHGKCGGTAVLGGCDNKCGSTKKVDCAGVCGGTTKDVGYGCGKPPCKDGFSNCGDYAAHCDEAWFAQFKNECSKTCGLC